MWSASEKFLADDGWAIASYIGLTLLTSLFPFLIFVAALAGFLGSEELAKEAARLVFAEWPKEVAGPISEQVSYVLTAPRGGLLTLGVVLASYFASSAIEALRVGLNRAYGLTEKRPWWLLRLQSLVPRSGRLARAPGARLPGRAGAAHPRRARGLPALGGRRARPFDLRPSRHRGFMVAISLLLAHLILPAHRPRIVDLLPGVALTFVGSIAFGEAFGAYLSEYVRNYISMYAGLASVMIALVYLYWVALLFVFGGELNAAIMRAREQRPT